MDKPHLTADLFKDSYVIFIDPLKAKTYASFIEECNYSGCAVLETNWENKWQAIIVIPNSQNFKKIETELFQFKNDNHIEGGFWGQYGLTLSYWKDCTFTKV